MDHFTSGRRLTPPTPLGGKGGSSGALSLENPPTLADAIKMVQKKCEPFKDAWAMYCQEKGSWKLDPSKHNTEFLMQFLGCLATGTISAWPASGPGSGPPSKRMRDSSGGGAGTSTGDPFKD